MIFPEAFRYAYQGTPYSSKPGDPFGMFVIPPQKLEGTLVSCSLKAIATDGMIEGEPLRHCMGCDELMVNTTCPTCVIQTIADPTAPPNLVNTGWEHVSVSPLKLRRCPTWLEMEAVRELFWEPDAVVVQLSVARANHISVNHFCLHMWRSTLVEQPLPPSICV